MDVSPLRGSLLDAVFFAARARDTDMKDKSIVKGAAQEGAAP